MKTDYILGVKVNTGITRPEVIDKIDKLLNDGGCHIVTTTNAEFVMSAQSDPEFRDIINSSALSVPDGAGILYAKYYIDTVNSVKKNFIFPIKALLKGIWFGISSLFIKYPLGDRVSGVELMYDLCDYAEKYNKSVFLLGGWPKDKWGKKIKTENDLAKQTQIELQKKYPKLNIVGAISKYTPKEQHDEETIEYIKFCMKKKNVNSIDLLFVAYNHPNQEKWICRNNTKIPVKVGIGIGGSFDYIAQTQTRSPQKFIDLNLEWLYKLFTQPWRIRRIFTAFPIFPIRVFLYSIRKS
jgi:N-acetylglucosaminyldiphosphoundecaprenol N-acetyl-beta-D-mannosaminyltransferase